MNQFTLGGSTASVRVTHHVSRFTFHASAMNKTQLIQEAARRGGLPRARAARAVEAMLNVIKRELGDEHQIVIRGLGRLQLKPKRAGFAPNQTEGAPPVPIPVGKAVRLKATRQAVASLNTEQPLKLDPFESISGGTITMSNETHNPNTVNEGSALGLDV